MPDTPYCAKCWTALTADTTDGLCPACRQENSRGEPPAGPLPEIALQKRWMGNFLDRVSRDLEKECVANGQKAFFDALRPQLLGKLVLQKTAALAAQLGLKEDALHVARHRIRKRFMVLLHAELDRIIASPEGIDEKLLNFIVTLRRSR